MNVFLVFDLNVDQPNAMQILKTEVCDGIIAPGFEPEALEILRNKKKVRDLLSR